MWLHAVAPACAGKDHLVLADMGCRNTVFNATAQSGLPFLPEFAAAGVGCFRQVAYFSVQLRGCAVTVGAANIRDEQQQWQQQWQLWQGGSWHVKVVAQVTIP